jgi:hypothetical protein
MKSSNSPPQPSNLFASLIVILTVLLAAGGFLSAIPPLSLEGLREEKLPEATADSDEKQKANQSCYVCHGNMKTDELVLGHIKDRIGCMRCHGESVEHRNDEDNTTPPDKMFARDKIDPMCIECHPQHNVPGRKVAKRMQERGLASQNPDELICTSCHYQHKLAHRTVVWDKTSGKLLMKEPQVKTGKTSTSATSSTTP